MSPLNRRLTVFLLGFVSLSLAASVLPLVPEVQSWLPFEPLTRDGAMAVYALFLVGFMVFVYPLFADFTRRERRGWEWLAVGTLTLLFACVPLFVTAYIAGVHRRGVLAVLLWAASAQWLMSFLVLLFGAGARRRLILVSFSALVLVPMIGEMRGLLSDSPLAARWQPFLNLLDITRRFQEPPLLVLALATCALVALTWTRLVQTRRTLTLAAFLLIGAAIFTSSAMTPASKPLATNVFFHAPMGEWMLPGRPWPLRIAVNQGEARVQVECAGRETYHMDLGGADGASVWVYPILHETGETIRILADSREVGRFVPRVLPASHGFRTAGWITRGDSNESAPIGLPSESVTLAKFPADHLDGPALWFESMGALVVDEDVLRGLSPRVYEAVRSRVHEGWPLLMTRARAGSPFPVDWGPVSVSPDGTWPAGFQPRVVNPEPLDGNLYSHFELPDWGQIDLSRLMIVLVLYHVAFYLAFLLPLLLDSRKSHGVYLSSVAFVVILLAFGGRAGLRVVLLRDTQILQQNIGIHIADHRGQNSTIRTHQIACFASFNGESDRILLRGDLAPVIAHESKTQGAGDIRIEDGGDVLVLDHPVLSRRTRRLAVKLASEAAAPLTWTHDGDVVRLLPQAGAADPMGFLSHPPIAAFVRSNGRIYPAKIAGDEIHLGRDAAPPNLRGVLPDSEHRDRLLGFTRYLLGRHILDQRPVLVLMLDGVKPLHDDPRYLLRRNLLNLLTLPLDEF